MNPKRQLSATALAATLLLSTTAFTEAPPGALFTGGTGCIRDRGSRACQPAHVGARLRRFQTFVADRDARVGLGQGAWVQLTQGAEVEIAPETPVLIGSRSVLAKTFRLVRGRAEIETSGAPVLATGPLQTAGLVRLGSAVARSDDGSFVVGALNGNVAISVSGTTLEVPASTVRSVRRGEGRVGERPALTPPRFDLARTVAIATTGTAELPLRWEGIAGARGYEVRLRGGRSPIVATTSHTELALGGIEPGEYFAEIRAQDQDGLPGAWSAARPIHVVGVSAPPGSRLRGGALAIPERAYVQLAFTDGLEARFDGSDRTMAAPQSIRTIGGNPQTLHLRAPGDREDTTLRVEPRAIHAVVEMSPANPRWPNDVIHVALRVTDDAGEDALDETSATATALLGLEPLALDWHREGNELRADVPPRALIGPDVVRVEVHGKDGALLGHMHREIDVVHVDAKALGPDGTRASRGLVAR